MEAGAKSANRPQVKRQEGKKERAIGFRRQRDHLALLVGRRMLVDPLQVSRFPAQPRTIIDELAVDLAGGIVNKIHLAVLADAELYLYSILGSLGQASCPKRQRSALSSRELQRGHAADG